MNRKILFLFVIGTFSANIFCQTRFGGGLLISTPKMDTYSFGAGFGAKAKFYVAKSVALGALVSYEHFFNKNGWEDEWEALP